MQKESKLEETLCMTLEPLKEEEYRDETLHRYKGKFHVLNSLVKSMGLSEPSEELFKLLS